MKGLGLGFPKKKEERDVSSSKKYTNAFMIEALLIKFDVWNEQKTIKRGNWIITVHAKFNFNQLKWGWNWNVQECFNLFEALTKKSIVNSLFGMKIWNLI